MYLAHSSTPGLVWTCGNGVKFRRPSLARGGGTRNTTARFAHGGFSLQETFRPLLTVKDFYSASLMIRKVSTHI